VASNDSEPDIATTSGRGDGADAPARGPAASAPLIGITTYLEQAQSGVWDLRASFLPKVYLDAVTDAGGIAVLLPPQPVSPAIARTVLASLDGLIVSGGADVDPARYGQEPHPRTGAPRTDRDEWEDALLTEAIATELPFLGICRGAQVLNVALGGTLVQHLPDLTGGDTHRAGPGRFAHHDVRIVPGTRLAVLLGESAGAACYHHQALADLAPGLVATGHAEDGVVEAVELPAARFVLAVQWHPEQIRDDVRLFRALVEAASTVPAVAGAVGRVPR